MYTTMLCACCIEIIALTTDPGCHERTAVYVAMCGFMSVAIKGIVC